MNKQVIARRDDMPPRRSRRIYVRARTDPQSAQLWWPGLGAARLAAPRPGGTDRRTDGPRHRLIPPMTGGKISKKRIAGRACYQSAG